jgi:hypothetical protein
MKNRYTMSSRFIIAPKGNESSPGYRSLFGFFWWFWLPRIMHKAPDAENKREIRFIWLCFAAFWEIGKEPAAKA